MDGFPILNQSTAAVVDGCGTAAYGDRTMVAGIVHMIAPRARLMPMKAFTARDKAISRT